MLESKKVSVLALGNWGTALGNHLAAKGYNVCGWSNDKEIVTSVNTKNINPKYLSTVKLNPKLKASEDINDALSADYIVMAFPSSALNDIVPKLNIQNRAVLISAIKGLEEETLFTPLQFAREKLNASARMAVLSGPSFARDIISHRPSGVVASADNEVVAREVSEIFSSDWMKVYLSSDPLGVELGGIVKNCIAIAAGACDGLGLGDSARAGLITRGLAEMTRLAVAMGADMRTIFGLSGLGDLVVTATSTLSRNRTVGFRMGQGEKLEDVLTSLGSVAEGVTTAPLVLKLAERYKVDMPIVWQIAHVFSGEITPAQAVKNLLSRPVKREFEG